MPLLMAQRSRRN